MIVPVAWYPPEKVAVSCSTGTMVSESVTLVGSVVVLISGVAESTTTGSSPLALATPLLLPSPL